LTLCVPCIYFLTRFLSFHCRRQHAFMANTQKQQPPGGGSGSGSVTHSPERLRGATATQDLFELLERVQCSRLDDQRCVLPAYFSQVGKDGHPSGTHIILQVS